MWRMKVGVAAAMQERTLKNEKTTEDEKNRVVRTILLEKKTMIDAEMNAATMM